MQCPVVDAQKTLAHCGCKQIRGAMELHRVSTRGADAFDGMQWAWHQAGVVKPRSRTRTRERASERSDLTDPELVAMFCAGQNENRTRMAGWPSPSVKAGAESPRKVEVGSSAPWSRSRDALGSRFVVVREELVIAYLQIGVLEWQISSATEEAGAHRCTARTLEA
jgi:hypothetical protein